MLYECLRRPATLAGRVRVFATWTLRDVTAGMALTRGPHLLGLPPAWQPDESSDRCTLCTSRFAILRRHRHHCRNCGRLVCAACSPGRWDSRCLPKGFNRRGERSVRVCAHCVITMGEFKSALRAGDVTRCQQLRDAGFVSVTMPLPGEGGRRPVHVAAVSGAIGVMRWLADTRRCSLTDTDDHLRTPLALAAGARQMDMVALLVGKYGRTTREIADVVVLQDVLGMTLGGAAARPEAGGSSHGGSPQALLRQASIMSVSCGDLSGSVGSRRASLLGVGLGAGATAGAGAAAGKKAGKPSSGPAGCGGGAATDDEEEEDDGACLVCWDGEAIHCLVPCGHLVYCAGCVPAAAGACPVCRVAATSTLRVFKP